MIEANAMDFVLAIVEKAYDGVTTFRGFRSSETIDSSELPFAQAFEPTTAADANPFSQQLDALSFRLLLYDAPGQPLGTNADKMRVALSAIQRELERNPTLSGLVESAILDTFNVNEGEASGKIISSADITVTFQARGVLNEVGADVTLVDIEGTASIVTMPLLDLVRDGVRIEKSLEFQNINAGQVNLTAQLSLSGGFPSFDAFKDTRLARFDVYLYPELDGPNTIMDRFQVTLFEQGSPNFLFSQYNFDDPKIGWNQFVVDIDNRDGGFGAPSDWTNVAPIIIQIVFRHTNTAVYDDFSATLAKISYRPEDAR